MPAVAKQVVDAFIRDAEVHAVLVWAGVTLGGEGFLSTAVAFHFPPRLGRLFGCGSFCLSFSTRQKEQSSAVLCLSGRDVFGFCGVFLTDMSQRFGGVSGWPHASDNGGSANQ